MNAVSWNPEILLVRGSDMQSSLADVISEAKRRQGLRIRMERSQARAILGSIGCGAVSGGQFREGCVKAVELGMQPLPQKARVLAEIHRRIDRLSETAEGSGSWQSGLASIISFAGAWALAARLMRAGLSVCIREENPSAQFTGCAVQERADVELVIPIGPA
ncbi:hypothetical protein KKG90_01435 [Candidatus Bipolaricaulota bacterium]|nr:hypothetical protein [Candidatus Bipolaricaulota bacterium]